MFKILTINYISPQGLDFFPKDQYTWGDNFLDPDALILRAQNIHDFDFMKKLKAVGKTGTNTDNIPVQELSDKGIVVFNTPGANANAVKELVICSMLSLGRKTHQAYHFVQNSLHADFQEQQIQNEILKSKDDFFGQEIQGKTLGIIGLGIVGIQVANAALSLGMNVIGLDPQITVDAAWSLNSQVKQATRLEDLLRVCDFVTIHVPLQESTKNLINRSNLRFMKPTASLLNFSRDSIVNNQDIILALNENLLANYATDFPSPLLLGHPNVLCYPNLGTSSLEAEENSARMIVHAIREYLENGNITNSVNFPSVSLPREGNRITFSNKNVPNILGQVSSLVAQEKLNILNMVNKSKGPLAYTIIDVDHAVPGELTDAIMRIDGVIQVRVIPLEYY